MLLWSGKSDIAIAIATSPDTISTMVPDYETLLPKDQSVDVTPVSQLPDCPATMYSTDFGDLPDVEILAS